MNTKRTFLYGTIICFFFLVLLWPSSAVFSQRIGIAHSDYMRTVGLEDDFTVLKNILKNELVNRINDKPDAYYEDNANFFSMVLLLSGVQPTHYYQLQQNGVDVVNAMTADVRPFSEQSLFSDLVITGVVTEIVAENIEEDGFDITVKVEIAELLKGEAPGDTILIRQRNSSRLPGSDTRPELHRSYLFLLSSGMYGYHKANHQFRQKSEIVVTPPQFGEENTFVIYRIYPYINGDLQRSSQNKETVFRSIRMVDFLLKQ